MKAVECYSRFSLPLERFFMGLPPERAVAVAEVLERDVGRANSRELVPDCARQEKDPHALKRNVRVPPRTRPRRAPGPLTDGTFDPLLTCKPGRHEACRARAGFAGMFGSCDRRLCGKSRTMRPSSPAAATIERKKLLNCRIFSKPSDGLEPSTPSLPWRFARCEHEGGGCLAWRFSAGILAVDCFSVGFPSGPESSHVSVSRRHRLVPE